MKNEKISKEIKKNTLLKNPKNEITSKHLRNLDNIIQQSLDKFKFIDPKQEFYESTGEEKDLVISHKSTIPNLVIWNKKFNKNYCFEEGNTKEYNSFPRFQFYLRIKSNKPEKDKRKERKEKEKNNQNKKNKENKEGKNRNKKKQDNKNINKNNNNNIANNNSVISVNINNVNNISNNNKMNDTNNNEIINNNFSKREKKIFDLSDLDINKIKEFNPRHKNNFFSSNKEIINLNDNNQFIPVTDKNISNNYNKQYHINNNINRLINNTNNKLENKNKDLIISIINFNKINKGWIVMEANNGSILGIFNSFELFIYLSNNVNKIMKLNIIDIKQMAKLSGDKMFNILSQYYDFNNNNNQFKLNQIENLRQQQIKQNNSNQI